MTKRRSPRSFPLFLPRRIRFIELELVTFFSLMSHHCIRRRLVSRGFQTRQWKQPKVIQGRAWERKAFDLEIGMQNCNVVLSTLRRPILMLRSCCSRPGTRSRGSYLTLLNTASILPTEPSRVERSGSTSCIRPLAFTTFLPVKSPSSWHPSHPSLNLLGSKKIIR
jgi:hypothetical protein